MRFCMILNIVNDRGDWDAFCKKLHDAGFHGIRGGVDTLLGNGHQFNVMTPFRVVGEWDLGKVVAGWPVLPICSLAEWNEEFWTILEQRLRVMKQYGLVPWFFMEDRCSEVDSDWHKLLNSRYGCIEQFPEWKTPEYYHPTTGAGLNPKHSGGVQAEDLMVYGELVDERLADLCRTIGFPEFWAEPKNEYGYEPRDASAYPWERQRAWFERRAFMLEDSGFTVVGSIREPVKWADVKDHIKLCDVHQVLRVGDFYLTDGLDPAEVIVDTDGNTHGEGDIVSCVSPGYRGPSVDQSRTLGGECVRRGFKHVVILEQGVIDRMEDDAGREIGWNFNLVPKAVLVALTEGMGDTPPDPPPPPVEYVTVTLCTFTKKLANPYCPATVTEKFVPGTEPTAQCVVHKAPPAPPQSCWARFMADRPIRKMQLGKWIRCVLGI